MRLCDLAAFSATICATTLACAFAPARAFAQSDPVNDPVPPFIPPPPGVAPPPASRFDLYPSNHALRSLVLPPLVTSETVSFVFDADTPFAAQTANVGLGAAIGVGVNSDLALDLTLPDEGALQMRLGYLFRLIRTTPFEFGLGLDFGVRALTDSAHRDVLLRPGFQFPMYLRAGNIFRVETGVFLSANIPTNGAPASASLVRWGVDPYLPTPGIPLGFTFQPFQSLFFGLGTGFGVGELRAGLDRAAATSFMSLDAHFGGTVSLDHRPLLDLIGRFAFPYFLVGESKPPTTEAWQIGIAAQTFAAL